MDWEVARGRQKPKVPEVKRGPKFGLKNGKLSGIAVPPSDAFPPVQGRLHSEISNAVREITAHALKVENRYPELVNALKQYKKLLDTPTSELDLVGVWAVGGSLTAFSAAYREQNAARTLAEPLEPQLAALLVNVSRLHGAFMIGFEETRKLVEDADEFLADRETLLAVQAAGSELLEVLTNDGSLIDEETRKLHRPVDDYVTEFGWASSQVGYAAYLIVRNGTISLIKITVGNDNLGNIVSGALALSLMAGDPNFEFIHAAVIAIKQHASALLAFYSHSPEFRAYVEWALALLYDIES